MPDSFFQLIFIGAFNNGEVCFKSWNRQYANGFPMFGSKILLINRRIGTGGSFNFFFSKYGPGLLKTAFLSVICFKQLVSAGCYENYSDRQKHNRDVSHYEFTNQLYNGQ